MFNICNRLRKRQGTVRLPVYRDGQGKPDEARKLGLGFVSDPKPSL